MTIELVDFSDRLVSSGSPSESNIRDVRSVLGRFLVLNKQVNKKVEGHLFEEGAHSPVSGHSPEKETQVACFANEFSGNSTSELTATLPSEPSSLPPQLSLQRSAVQRHVSPGRDGSAYPGFADPYRNTIWTPPIVPDMDNSIVPHILSGRDSFSSRLYYETINLAVRSLKGEAPWEFAASMFRYKLQYASRVQLFGVLAGVLEMLLLGTNQVKEGAVPQRVVEDNGAVKAGIVGQILAEGGSENEYLSSSEVEQHLKSRWALRIDSTSVRFQRPRVTTLEEGYRPNVYSDRLDHSASNLAPTLLPGFSSAEPVVLGSEGLLNGLKMAALTIGAGPRWHVASIDNAVKVFLEQNNANRQSSQRVSMR
jgi:hypothetical protein